MFRIPGPSQPGDSLGEAQALSVATMPALPDDVPLAGAAPSPPPVAPARPAFGTAKSATPSAAAPTTTTPKAATPASPPAAPAKPAAAASQPAAKKPTTAASTPPAAKKPEPEPEPLPLDDDEEPAPTAADPFAFDADAEAKPKKKRNRNEDEDDEDDEDDKPRSKRKPRDDDDEEDKPKRKKAEPTAAPAGDPFAFDVDTDAEAKPKKKRNRDEDDEDEDDEPKPKKKSRDDEPAPSKKAAATPAAAAAGDPFAFDAGPEPEVKSRKKSRDDDDEDEKPKAKKKRNDDDDDDDRDRKKDRKKKRDDDDDEEEGGRRYVPPSEQKSGKTLLIAIILGLAALGAAIGAVVILNKEAKEAKEAEAAKNKEKEKKEEPPTVVVETPKDPKKDPKDPKKDPKDPKKDPKDPKNPIPPDPSDPQLPALALDASIKLLQFQPFGTKLEVKDVKPAGAAIPIEAVPAKVKRVFAPGNRLERDAIAVWQSVAGAGGKGEKLTVDIHSGNAGVRVGRFDYDGDGKDAKCDVSPDGKAFVASNADGKITVWNLAEAAKPKVLDGYDPYADASPEHKAAGLAAVYFAAAPGRFLTVSTAGAVHLHDVAMKKRVEGFTPTNTKSIPNRVALGRSVAVDDARTSLVLAIAGIVYQLDTASLTQILKIDMKADFGRPLAIGVLGVPGRIVFAFETDANSKKEKAVMFCLPKEQPTFLRWAEATGEPLSAGWAGSHFVVIGTDKGAVYLGAGLDEKKFSAVAFAEVPGGKMLHAANEYGHWYLTGDAGGTRSSFQQLKLDDLTDFRNELEGKDPPTVRLTDKGITK